MFIYTEKVSYYSPEAFFTEATLANLYNFKNEIYPEVEKVLSTEQGKRNFSKLVGDYINRNYIREDYGSDVLVNKFYVDYTIQQKETGVVIVKTRRDNKLSVGVKPTIMTYYKENGYFRLQPENDYMEPILVYGELQILGKVIGVFRFMH